MRNKIIEDGDKVEADLTRAKGQVIKMVEVIENKVSYDIVIDWEDTGRDYYTWNGFSALPFRVIPE